MVRNVWRGICFVKLIDQRLDGGLWVSSESYIIQHQIRIVNDLSIDSLRPAMTLTSTVTTPLTQTEPLNHRSPNLSTPNAHNRNNTTKTTQKTHNSDNSNNSLRIRSSPPNSPTRKLFHAANRKPFRRISHALSFRQLDAAAVAA